AAAKDSGLHPHGLSFHVGSQCLNNKNWVDALDMARAVFDDAAKAGMELESVDIGGGFPVQYDQENIDISETCRVISEHFHKLFGEDTELVAEPGRGVVGDAVILVTKVISEANRNGHDWLYFDDGTYGSFMEVLLYNVHYPLRTNTMGPVRPYILAGPTCDSIDVFSRNGQGAVVSEHLPEMHLDDLLIAGSMGAYTYSEATRFNGFEPPEFFYLD
ncbi:MAG: ornithine decarboxylase, partial [Candidatus Krumholzibacteriia bacterium]